MLKTLQWPTNDLTPGTSLTSISNPKPLLAHFLSAMVSLLFPEHAKHTFVLGPLHLSFPLPLALISFRSLLKCHLNEFTDLSFLKKHP